MIGSKHLINKRRTIFREGQRRPYSI